MSYGVVCLVTKYFQTLTFETVENKYLKKYMYKLLLKTFRTKPVLSYYVCLKQHYNINLNTLGLKP